MPQTALSTGMETGIATLDGLHCDLFETMSVAACATDKNFADCYSALVKKMKCALLIEEQWMGKIDSTLLKIYQEQHARILSTLDNVHRKVLEEDYCLARKIVQDLLPQWYTVHVSTLDMALAIALQVNDIQAVDSISQSSGIYID